MRFRNGHADRLQLVAVTAELAAARGFREAVENVPREEFGRGVDALESRDLVEILVVERLQDQLSAPRARARYRSRYCSRRRSFAMKAASTTKVAPCSACAGPNTSPRNECAIMMWSRTSTVYTNSLQFVQVIDALAQYPASGFEHIRQSFRQIFETGSPARSIHREQDRTEAKWRLRGDGDASSAARCDGATWPT